MQNHTTVSRLIAPWTLAAALCVPTLAAQGTDPLKVDSGQEPSEQAVEVAENPDLKTKARILSTKNGSFVRERCHLEPDHPGGPRWVFGNKKKPQSIPASFVSRVELERDALKEFKQKRKDKATDSELAEWCLERGLLTEGLMELDQALRSHGERAKALPILERYDRFLPDPPDLKKLGAESTPADKWDATYAWLSPRHTPCLEWLAASGFAKHAKTLETSTTEEDPWLSALAEKCNERDRKKRSFALTTLRHLRDQHSGPDLRRFALLDRNEQVREQAGWLIGTLDEPAQVSELHEFLEHKNIQVRILATQALGQAGYAASAPALVAAFQGASGGARRVPHAHIFIGNQTAYVQDFSPEIAAGSSIADPEVNVLVSGAVLDAGVMGIEIHRQYVYIRRALAQVTGHRPGGNASAWMKFLESYPTIETDWRAPWVDAAAVPAIQKAD